MLDATVEKIYAGFLGMDAGMRLGAPVENPYWTYERLKEYYGDMHGYLREQKNFSADDDVNGPVILLRALTDSGITHGFTAKAAGETWLNYTRYGKGMFWWGGEDLSTEHRAFMNLRRGIPAPESGSAAQNGLTAAEQIGGQIFIDTWGLICPGRPHEAAEYARTAASVSHDGNGLHGAAFMAACIAAAFCCRTVDEVLDAGLREIPAACHYREVVNAVRAFHAAHPKDFRACRDYIDREWGADRFPGYCHIVPNAGICVLAMLYGGGNLDRTIEIACMCGFDTDCNASNTGTILGVLSGLSGIPERYRAPINDSVVLSSVSGSLNILDVPTFVKELVFIACVLSGESVPDWIVQPKKGELLFDFELPGSTHGLTISDHASHELRPVEGKAHTGTRCLELQIDGKTPDPVELSFRAFYTRDDFNEERYDPVFAPRVYPGQMVKCWMKSCQTAPADITVTPYVTCAMTGRHYDLPASVLPEGEWKCLAFTVPDLGGDEAHEVGWRLEIKPKDTEWAWGKVYIDDISVTGPMTYGIDMSLQREEFKQITPFSFNDASGALEEGNLCFTTVSNEYASGGQAFTGNYYTKNGSVEASVTVKSGTSAGLLLRGQGCRRYYELGFAGKERAAISRFESGKRTELASVPFRRERGRTYRLAATAEGSRLSLFVDGEKLLEAKDDRFSYGMVGISHAAEGVSVWNNFHITGTC